MFQTFYRHLFVGLLCSLLAACSYSPEEIPVCQESYFYTPAPQKATSRPYQIKGIWYCPQPHFEYDEVGIASYYGGGDVFHGRPTATGEIFDMNGMTAAHKTVPLPCVAEVTNLENGRQLTLKINDRGPFIEGRIIDVSRRVAQLLGFEGKGTARVRVRTLVLESLALNSMPTPTVLLAESSPSLTIAALIPESGSKSPRHSAPLKVGTRTAKSSTPPSSREEKSGIFVDVGEYTTRAQAKKACQKLMGFGDTPLRAIEKKGQKPYAVRVGPFITMAAANEILDQLGKAGHLSRIVIIHP